MSKRKKYIVATDINYLNEIKLISHPFDNIKDAESFKEHCEKTIKYEKRKLIIVKIIK